MQTSVSIIEVYALPPS